MVGKKNTTLLCSYHLEDYPLPPTLALSVPLRRLPRVFCGLTCILRSPCLLWRILRPRYGLIGILRGPCPCPIWRLLASSAQTHSHSARPHRILRGPSALNASLRRPYVSSTHPFAQSVHYCPISAPPPRGVKVIYSTIATHRPMDYSSSYGLFIAL